MKIKKIFIMMLIIIFTLSLSKGNVYAKNNKIAVPKIKSVTATDLTTFKIKWKKVKNCSGYVLYCKEGSGRFKILKRLGKNKTSYIHKGLTKGKKYVYKIRAYKGKRYSNFSNIKARRCTNYLLDIIEPYEKPYYYNVNNVKMGGDLYKHGFKCMGYGDEGYGNVTSFNLKGKYSKISFISGIIDGDSELRDADIYVYTDGELAEQIPIKANQLPKYHSVNIENCAQLSICVYSGCSVAMWDSDYGIAEIKIYK